MLVRAALTPALVAAAWLLRRRLFLGDPGGELDERSAFLKPAWLDRSDDSHCRLDKEEHSESIASLVALGRHRGSVGDDPGDDLVLLSLLSLLFLLLLQGKDGVRIGKGPGGIVVTTRGESGGGSVGGVGVFD